MDASHVCVRALGRHCLLYTLFQHVNSGGGGGGVQARSKDQEILEEGGGAGPSPLPRRDHE